MRGRVRAVYTAGSRHHARDDRAAGPPRANFPPTLAALETRFFFPRSSFPSLWLTPPPPSSHDSIPINNIILAA